MRIKHDFKINKLADNYVIYSTERISNNGVPYILKVNYVGKTIFEMLLDEITMDELITKSLRLFDGDSSFIEGEVISFVQKLEADGIISTDN